MKASKARRDVVAQNGAGRVERTGLRILRIADVPESLEAGVSGFMLLSGAALAEQGNEVSYWFSPQLAPWLPGMSVRKIVLPWLVAAKLLLERPEVDVVELHEPLSGPFAALTAARRVGPACVVLSHGIEERGWAAKCDHRRRQGRPVNRLYAGLVELLLLRPTRSGLRSAGAVITVSSEDRQYVIERVGRRPDDVLWCWRPERAAPSGDPVAEGPPRPHPARRILFLGTWLERKGVRELLEAWDLASADFPDAELTIAGCGDSDGARSEAATRRRLHVVPRVSRQQLATVLAEHDIFLLPSHFEGLPLALLEAAAAGLACVVSSTCGMRDVIRPTDPAADGGLLVPPYEAQRLADALREVLTDPRATAKLGERAASRARAFSWATVGLRCASAYELAHRSAR